jgi:adenine phosphoribosyltransferase
MTNYNQHIREVLDFPKPGVAFLDISPLLANPEAFRKAITDMSEGVEPTHVVGFDARGFLFATPIAQTCNAGTVMLRKPGKLPGDVDSVAYDLEYGQNRLEIQSNILQPGDNALLVDDVIATGGTASAGIELVRRTGANIIGFHALIDIVELGGRSRIEALGVPVRALVEIGAVAS